MRVRLLEETDFGCPVRRNATRRSRVLAAWFDAECCTFLEEAAQLDEQCLSDFTYLMLDLCRKARSGAPLAGLFGSGAWRDLGALTVKIGSDVISVPTFLVSRQHVGVIGFVAGETDVVMFSCKKGRTSPGKAALARLLIAAHAFCECQAQGALSLEQ